MTLELRIVPGWIPGMPPGAQMFEEYAPGEDDSLWLGVYKPCMMCRQETCWAELNFEGPLCPGKCTDQMWREYHKANRQMIERNR